MSRYIIDDFLDNEKFITKKQKETYIKEGRFQGNSKKSIQLAFERYYESFKWLRKKKGQPMKFELGEKRKIPIENDGRTSSQTTEATTIAVRAIKNFITKNSRENRCEEDEDFDNAESRYISYHFKNNPDRLALTPLNWLVYSGLIGSEFKEYTKEYYEKDYTKDEYYWKRKYYVDMKKRAIQREFNKVAKKIHFIKIPILVSEDNYSLMASIEASQKIDRYIKLLKGYSEKEREEKINMFLNNQFGAKSMYYVYQTKLLDYGIEDISEDKIMIFRQYIKNRTDKEIINKQSRVSIEYTACARSLMELDRCENVPKIENSIRDYEGSIFNRAILDRGMFSLFTKLDEELGFGKSIKNNLELFIKDDLSFNKNVENRMSEFEDQINEITEIEKNYPNFF